MITANGESKNTNAVGLQYFFKDIYVITNDINGKQYVGQSINPEKRFLQHKNLAGKDHYSLLHNAMQKYGTEHFSLKILEHKVKDYNEREKYWIKELKTICPNGYNGGSSLYIPKKKKRKYSEEDFWNIVNDIKDRSLSWEKISRKWKTSDSQIRDINNGRQYFHEELEYPIRTNSNLYGILKTKEEIENIHKEILSGIDFTILAKKYSCEKRTIQKINRGRIKSYRLDNYRYPLIPEKDFYITEEQQENLIKLLQENTLTFEEIAEKMNLSYGQIINFNSGRYYYKKDLIYPLRKTRKIDKIVIDNAKKMLYQGFSNCAIQEKLQISERTICRINSGSSIYYDPNYYYPIKIKNSAISRETIEKIQKDLLCSSISLRKISEKYNIKLEQVQQINTGSKKSYYYSNLKYPLRKY